MLLLTRRLRLSEPKASPVRKALLLSLARSWERGAASPAGLRSLHSSALLCATKPATKKKVKMSDEEFFEKAKPLLYEESKSNYLAPKTRFTPSSIVIGEGLECTKEISFKHLPMDTRDLDNVQFRKRLANMVHTSCHIHGIFRTLTSGFVPRISLSVEWQNETMAYWGNPLTVDLVKEAPKVSYAVAAKAQTYWTLLLVGQNYENTQEEHVFWAVSNINGSDVASGHVLQDYSPPKPLNEGLWRFTFVLSQQEAPNSKTLPERTTFKTDSFLTENSLIPKGISFFYIKSHPQVLSFPERNFKTHTEHF